jgi:hypothetical protein
MATELVLPSVYTHEGELVARQFDGSGFGMFTGGDFRRLSGVSGQIEVPALLESHRPVDDKLFIDLYQMCLNGALREAVQLAQQVASRPYLRPLREGLVHTDLDTALDGSVYTKIFDGWNEVSWPWAEVLEEDKTVDHYESMKLDTLGELLVDDQTANKTQSGTLPEVPASHGFDEAAIGEKYETLQVKDYGATFSITDRTMRKDNKRTLALIPTRLGRAARYTVSASVAYLFEQASGAGPTMSEDSAVAFSSTNGNYTNVDITQAYVEAAVAAMAGMTAYGSSRVMGLEPTWLVVPAALKVTASKIVNDSAIRMIDGTATAAQGDWNPLAGNLKLSVWPALTDTDSWMLMTSYQDFPTAVYAFLDGQQSPIIEVQGGVGPDLSNPLGRKYRVRIPHGVGLVDFRGVYRSIGAG